VSGLRPDARIRSAVPRECRRQVGDLTPKALANMGRVDPYNKRIDRNSDDNLAKVTIE